MRDELQMLLQKDFPFMQQNRVEEERNLYKRWGFECCDGWYGLIRELCQAISERYERDGKDVDIEVLQVKEKFATLRFYYKYKDGSCSIQALDLLGGASLRFAPNGGGDEETVQFRNDIADIVRSYEAKSGSVCEVCGEPGEIRKDLRWIRTLCESCYSKHPEKSK